ncbi:MAG: ABC transporter permease [Vicinamibacterales bacterium]
MRRGTWTLLVVGVVVLLAPLAAPYAPDAIDLANRRAGPSLAHWFGTDDLGRDAFSRALYGGRVSVAIGLLSAAVAVAIGVTAGALAAYGGGWIDTVLMRVTDALLAMPRLLLLMVAAATLQPTIPALVVLVGAVGWMETARVTRSAVRGLLGAEFVAAARALGAGHVRLLTRHLLANAAGAIRTAAVLAVARAVLVESALSFFGVGVQPPDASWGSMLYQAQSAMATEPWLALFPGACIVCTVGGLTAAADRA